MIELRLGIYSSFMSCSPLTQYSEITGALGNFTNTTVNILQSYWNEMLGSSPQTLNPIATNPIALPAVFKDGGFAAPIKGAWYPPAVCGALFSVGINAMWNSDSVFIVKIYDATLGQGAGAACNGNAQKGLLANKCGADGEAYIFIRWELANQAFLSPVSFGATAVPLMNLDKFHWQVWGAYASAPYGATGNSDNLAQYGLNLNTIALSSVRVQTNLGFWAQNTLGELETSITENIETITSSDLQAWNVLVCDLDAFAAKKHLDQSLGVSHTLVCCLDTLTNLLIG